MKVVVFSGTADGRALSERLKEEGFDVTVRVATRYGAEFMKDMDVRAGRLDSIGVRDAVIGAGAVVDATHPYAKEATENIKSGAAAAGVPYLRLGRKGTHCPFAVHVKSAAEAAEYLSDKQGKVFLSTGSGTLAEFIRIRERVKARVLDTPEVRAAAEPLGFDVIYAAPPFSYEDDIRDFRGCEYLVTKDGGTVGGTDIKIAAAKTLGMEVVMIDRPRESGTLSADEILRALADGSVRA